MSEAGGEDELALVLADVSGRLARGETRLPTLTDEQLASLESAPDPDPFVPRPWYAGQPDESTPALRLAALRALAAAGHVALPGLGEVAAALAEEELGLAGPGAAAAVRGDLHLLLTVRQQPSAVLLADSLRGQERVASWLYGAGCGGWLEETVDGLGMHRFRLVTTSQAVQRLVDMAAPMDLAPTEDAPEQLMVAVPLGAEDDIDGDPEGTVTRLLGEAAADLDRTEVATRLTALWLGEDDEELEDTLTCLAGPELLACSRVVGEGAARMFLHRRVSRSTLAGMVLDLLEPLPDPPSTPPSASIT